MAKTRKKQQRLTLNHVMVVIEDLRGEFKLFWEKLSSIDRKVDSLEGKIETIDGRLVSVESRLGSVEGRLGSVEGRLGSLEGRFDSFEGRFDSLEGKLDHHITESHQEHAELKASINFVSNHCVTHKEFNPIVQRVLGLERKIQ